MRDWLRDLGRRDGLAAAFDTRITGVPALTGRASRPIARILRRRDRRLIAALESFLVSSQSTLLDGVAARASRWGMTIGAASNTYLPPARLKIARSGESGPAIWVTLGAASTRIWRTT